tara:strand:+ start:51 stop:755 length:705 start_codon:yes stop_codon:yes gene_type:complete
MKEIENLDPDEIRKFNEMASTWWDPNGNFKALHDINPSRLDYILCRISKPLSAILDVGCGGGILTESLEAHTNEIMGIDAAPKPLKVAQLHAIDKGLKIDYRLSTVETLSKEYQNHFDVLTCMELLEHVTDFHSTVQACGDLTKPGGNLFFSTINRNPISFIKLIVGAEEILKILPRGTHEYQKFIKPSELALALRKANLELLDLSGISYNPFTRKTQIDKNVSANYIVHARKN